MPYNKYRNFYRLLSTGIVWKLKKFISTRKGYIYNFMKRYNSRNYYFIYIRDFMVDILKKPQSELDIIYVIELFSPYHKNINFIYDFIHNFDTYIYVCLKYKQYNNLRILLENYSSSINAYRIFNKIILSVQYEYKNFISYYNIGEKDNKLDNAKIFYYFSKIYDIPNVKIDTRAMYDVEESIILWYHTLHPFSIVNLIETVININIHYYISSKIIKSLIVIEQKKIFLLLVKIPNLNASVLFEPRVLKMICEF
jgi:hypothetical protein